MIYNQLKRKNMLRFNHSEKPSIVDMNSLERATKIADFEAIT